MAWLLDICVQCGDWRSFKLRQIARFVAICLVGASLAAAPAQPTDTTLTAVAVHLRSRLPNTEVEKVYPFELNAAGETLKPSGEVSAADPDVSTAHRKKAQRSDRAAYDRLVAKVKQVPAPGDGTLARAMKWVVDEGAGGYPPEVFFTASPDGNFAVFSAHRNQPLLLIDLRDLTTRQLLDDGGHDAPPVAWSADSQRLAFAPPKAGEVHVYDLRRQAIVSRKRGAADGIDALSWSPDGHRLAAFGHQNRHFVKRPIALIAAGAGHPVFTHDLVLQVFDESDDPPVTAVVEHRVFESSPPSGSIQWK